MGIQVRRVLKPRPKAAYDHASQTDPALVNNNNGSINPNQPPATVRTVRRARLLYPYSHKYLMTRVYRIFGLRHGVMMIAIHDLLLTSFMVFLLVLAAAHSREVSCIVEGDMQVHMQEHVPEHAPGHAEHPGHRAEHMNRSSYYMQYVQLAYEQLARNIAVRDSNELKLHAGLHVATILTMVMVFGISMAGIDMIASMMLFAGATLNVRQLMMPWLSLRLIELLLFVGGTLTLMLLYARGMMLLKVAVFPTLFTCIIAYHWKAAYSLHEHLCRMERPGALVHSTRTPGVAEPCACVRDDLICRFQTSRGLAWRPVVVGNPTAPFAPADVPDAGATPPPFDAEGAAADKNDLLTGSDRNLSSTTPPPSMAGPGVRVVLGRTE